MIQTEWVLFAFAAFLALGWSFVNGMHRRNEKRKREIMEAATKFPAATSRRLIRLLAPTRLNDRINHATVIAGCCTIICTPVMVVVMAMGLLPWWQPPLLVVGGTLVGAYVGEFAFNSWGCGLQLPNHATDRDRADAGGNRGESSGG